MDVKGNYVISDVILELSLKLGLAPQLALMHAYFTGLQSYFPLKMLQHTYTDNWIFKRFPTHIKHCGFENF